MKTVRQVQGYSMISNIVALTFIISGCSGLIHAFFNCSNYTFHENSTEGRSWETSRLLCQKSSEGDLVSIEEEKERNFVKNIIKNLTATEYFIGLKKENGKWKWLSNQTTVNSSRGKCPWAPGEPGQTSGPDQKFNCATIYGKYKSNLGRFDDLSCSRRMSNTGHICEKAVSCTKHERGPRATKETRKATPVVRSTTRSSWKGQPATKHLEKAEESSYLIAVVVSVLAAFVILGTCVALVFFLRYWLRIKGLKLKIQRYQRQSNSIKLEGLDGMSPAEQEMDDCESLPGVKRPDACDEDAIVKQTSSGQDQCNDCVYSVVDKTMKKRQPAKKPVPYQELVYADLSRSPKMSENGKIHQENTSTIYTGIDHIKSSATSDSTSEQGNEAKTD